VRVLPSIKANYALALRAVLSDEASAATRSAPASSRQRCGAAPRRP
jgi:hypothetical protein